MCVLFPESRSLKLAICACKQDQAADSENRAYTEYIKVPLDAGSLLIMHGAIQNDWQVTVICFIRAGND